MKNIFCFLILLILSHKVYCQGFLSNEEIHDAFNYSIETLRSAHPDSVYKIGINDVSEVSIDYSKYKNLHEVTYFVCRDLDLEQEILKLRNNQHLITLGVYSNNATSFPSAILNLRHLNTLILTGMEIDSIPSEIEKLNHLKELSLGHPFSGGISLKYLPQSISKLRNLKNIDLWGNMDYVLPNWFYKLELDELHITFLKGFEFNKVCEMLSLKTLTLEGTELKDLSGISKLTNLRELYFSQSNDLVSLGTDFINLPSLESLELKFVNSMDVKKEFQKLAYLPRLKSLQLDVEEGIEGLSNNRINGFKSLKELDITALGGNQTLDMANVLNSFSLVKSLEKLSLSRFKETQLPLELFQYSNLKTLKISSCDISSISSKIVLLTNLEELKFWYVPIKSLPKSLLKIPNLKGIYLGRTEVSEQDKVLEKLYKNGVKKLSWVN
mgnify:CR=1 FL=1